MSFDTYAQSGAPQDILRKGFDESRNPPEAESSSIWTKITNLLGNLDRPGGAVRSTLLGAGPAAGFKNPQDYHSYQPTDTGFNRLIGGLAEAAIDPLNFLGAKYLSPLGKEAGFVARLGGEVAQNVAARGASDLTREGLQAAGAPEWAQVAGQVGAGLAGGIGAAGAVRRMRPEEALQSIADSKPASLMAAVTPTTPTTDLAALQKADEASRMFSASDGLARDLRAQTLKNGGTEINADAARELAGLITDRYATFSGHVAQTSVDLMKESMDVITPEIRTNLAPTWVARVINGQINRNPIASKAALGGSNYIAGQTTNISIAMKQIDEFVKNEFGDLGEKVSLAANAPDNVKRAFTLARENQYANAAIGVIAENPEAFNLAPHHLAFLDDIQALTRADAGLSAQFGVDTSFLYKPFSVAIKEAKDAGDMATVARLTAEQKTGAAHSGILSVDNYARHMIELLGPDGKKLPMESWPRFLASERSFQKRRMLDSWTSIVESAADGGKFREQIQRALDAAVIDGDPEEIQRLQDLMRGGMQVGIRRATFAESVGERLSMSTKQRGEALAINTLRDAGGDALAENELKTLLNTSKVSDMLRIPAEVAGLLRGLQLRADLSIFGVQSWGSFVMGRGMKGLGEGVDGFFRGLLTEDGWNRYTVANADRMERWQLSNLELNTSVLELPEDLDLLRRPLYVPGKIGWGKGIDTSFLPGAPVKGPGTLRTTGTALPIATQFEHAVQYLDKIQFSRMATVWKVETADHLFGLMQAARDGHAGFLDLLSHPSLGITKLLGGFTGQTDEALRQAASSFTNNLYGGLNRVAKGRTVAQSLGESIFMLTPGFTRGTLSIGLQSANLLKWTPEYALSRDFAVRGTILAGMIVGGLSAAINGVAGGKVPTANITDPTKPDWMTIPLPGGHYIRPLSRFRSLGSLMGRTVGELASAGPMEAAQMFTRDSLRWATQRQSSLVTMAVGDPIGDIGRNYDISENMGNQYAQGQGVSDLLLNPSSDLKGQVAGIAGQVLPVGMGAATNVIVDEGGFTPQALKEAAFVFATELFGQGQITPTKMERNVRSSAAGYVAQAGVPQELVDRAVATGENPLNIKGPDGRELLRNAQQKEIAAKVAAEVGTSEAIVRQGGRMNAAQRKIEVDAISSSQTDNFFNGLKVANENYAKSLAQITTAAERGLPGPQISSAISDARKVRAAQKAVTEKVNPLALAFMQSPDYLAKQNSKDVLFSAISTEAYAMDFYDSNTLTYDFKGHDAWYARLREKYPTVFDEWLAQSEAKKTPLERDRDHAFSRLGTYFHIGDEVWQKVTGGQLGETEKEFDAQFRQVLQQQGVDDPGMQNYMIAHTKSNMLPVVTAHQLTTKLRDMMRAADPQVDDDVTKWLGAQPIELKRVSKPERALLNQLKAYAD